MAKREEELYSVAKQVIKGNYGNGDARRTALKQAGYNYDEVQRIVNSMYGSRGGSSSGGAAEQPQSQPQSSIRPREEPTWYKNEAKQPAAYDAVSDAAYQQALGALQAASQNAPTYANSYEGQLRDLYDQIVNRDKFRYDINGDALYQQYKDQYVQNGRLAMMDTMGQAAALTGGYGSSYGQAVGQQQYNAYLQQLNERIPELYGMAYDQYRDEGDRMAQQYAMLGDMASDEYAKYQDAYSRWANERDYAQRLADDAYARGYTAWKDNYTLALDRAETLAKSGDFSGYADVYGGEAARKMEQTWVNSNPDLAYRKGMITADEYRDRTGAYPIGYTPPSSGGGGGGGGRGYTPPKQQKETPPDPNAEKYSSSRALNEAIQFAGSSTTMQIQALAAMRDEGNITQKQYSDLVYAIRNPNR